MLSLDFLPDESRIQLERKIDSLPADQSQDLQRELLVGALLAGAGHKVVHEPVINGKTPDWYFGANSLEMLCEVARLRDESVIEGEQGIQDRKEELRVELEKLNFDVHLKLSASLEVDRSMATPFFNIDKLVSVIACWLGSSNLSELIADDFCINADRREPGRGIVVEFDLSYGRTPALHRLVATIEEKVKQRSAIVTNLPYVIVVVLEFDCGVTNRQVVKLFDDPMNKVNQLLRPPISTGECHLVQGVVLLWPDANSWSSFYCITNEASSDNLDTTLNELCKSAARLNDIWPTMSLR